MNFYSSKIFSVNRFFFIKTNQSLQYIEKKYFLKLPIKTRIFGIEKDKFIFC